MSTTKNPAQVSARVILSPEMTGEQIWTHFQNGVTDTEAVRLWAMDGHFDVTRDYDAINRMLPAADVKTAILTAMKRGETKAEKRGGLTLTYSDEGRIVANGLYLFGQSGVALCFKPAKLSEIIDALPTIVQGVLDKADAEYSAGERKMMYSKEYDDFIKAGKAAKRDEKETRKAAREKGIAKMVDSPHPRAGRSLLDFDGCDKATTLSKFRRVVDALRSAIGEPAKS